MPCESNEEHLEENYCKSCYTCHTCNEEYQEAQSKEILYYKMALTEATKLLEECLSTFEPFCEEHYNLQQKLEEFLEEK